MLFGEKDYIVYLLSNTDNINRTYLGITKNLSKTLKEHNGELKGGPRYTKFHKENGEWICSIEIRNLSKSEAITIERLSKCKRKGNNLQNSLEKRLNVIKPLLKYYPNCEIIELTK
tara:strand:+ start:4220 stop:4567 length:348 start_codon:yes stop_codon:yes gene_type:complete